MEKEEFELNWRVNERIINQHMKDKEIICKIRMAIDNLNKISIESSLEGIFFEIEKINTIGADQWTVNIRKIL